MKQTAELTGSARFIELVFTRDNRAVESYIQQQLTATSNT